MLEHMLHIRWIQEEFVPFIDTLEAFEEVDDVASICARHCYGVATYSLLQLFEHGSQQSSLGSMSLSNCVGHQRLFRWSSLPLNMQPFCVVPPTFIINGNLHFPQLLDESRKVVSFSVFLLLYLFSAGHSFEH